MLLWNVFCTNQPLMFYTISAQTLISEGQGVETGTHFHQSGLASSCCKSDLSSLPPLAFVVSSLAPWLFNHS